MIVGFREYDGNPSPEWLEAGAVLVGPDGAQYECARQSRGSLLLVV